MSFLHFRTQAHHLPELELDPPALDAGRSADEADYAEEHAREVMAAEMAAAPQPPVEPDPDGARLMMEYAADKLAADADFHAVCDERADAFIGWLSSMGSDPHAARPGVVGVRPSTPAPAAAAQAVAS